MFARRLIATVAAVSLSFSGCGRSLCHRAAPRPAYGPPPGSYAIPPTGIQEGPPPLPSTPRGSGAELLLPQPLPPGSSKSDYQPVPPTGRGAILGEPDYANDPPKIVDALPAEKEPPPAAVSPRHSTGVAANGIGEFSQVKEGVSTGLRPELGGLDWLKSQGYKTIVYLKTADDDDATDRRQVEKRDMTFVGLSVTPEGLTQAFIDEFTKRVGDTTGRPIFVYSRTGAAAGAVWYLHLRTAEYLTDDEARVRAAQLGLKDDKSALFQAALKLLKP